MEFVVFEILASILVIVAFVLTIVAPSFLLLGFVARLYERPIATKLLKLSLISSAVTMAATAVISSQNHWRDVGWCIFALLVAAADIFLLLRPLRKRSPKVLEGS